MAKEKEKMSKQTAPVPARASGGAVALPSFMQNQAGRGMESLGSGDYEIPRIKLLQAISPEVEQFDEAKNGVFWHTLNEQSLGASFNFVPVLISKRYVLWKPRHDGGGILARSDDGVNWTPSTGKFQVKPKKGDNYQETYELAPTVAASGLAEWGSSDRRDQNSPPAATQVIVIAACLPDVGPDAVAVLFLQRSNIKPARNLLGKLKMTTAPIFGCKIKAEAVKEEGAEGSYNNWRFTMNGYVQDENEFNGYRSYNELFTKMGLNVRDMEGAQDEASDATGPTGGAGADEKKY